MKEEERTNTQPMAGGHSRSTNARRRPMIPKAIRRRSHARSRARILDSDSGSRSASCLSSSSGALMVIRAESRTNKVALSAAPKAGERRSRRNRRRTAPHASYIGTLRPWVEASVGPQLVSAYVDTVLVRPGATVKRGDVLATLDCRNVSAESQAIASTARAIEARQRAVANESARVQGLLDGGFVSPNEAEQKAAQSVSEQAQLDSQRAQQTRSSLEVNDCILRAPFDGEVARRLVDPGAFARPGHRDAHGR